MPLLGRGMFRKDDEARDAWSEGGVRMCAARQAGILAEAWRALRPGGLLLYSTCTFNRTEDEEVLEAFAEAAGADAVETAEVPVDPAWGIVCGRAGVFRTYRFFSAPCARRGFLRRRGPRKSPDAGDVPAGPGAAARCSPPPRATRCASCRAGCTMRSACAFSVRATVSMPAPRRRRGAACACGRASGDLLGRGDGSDIQGVRSDPRMPWRSARPSTAEPWRRRELAHDEALDYLRRRDVAAHRFAEGMNLVCCGGRPLGWAKRIGSRVNNLYPESLRIWMNVSDKPSAEPNAVRVMPKRENDGKKQTESYVRKDLLYDGRGSRDVRRAALAAPPLGSGSSTCSGRSATTRATASTGPRTSGTSNRSTTWSREQGMTLDGAKRALRRRRGLPEADRDAELLERLLRVRTMLAEVREELKLGDGDPAESPSRRRRPAAVRRCRGSFRTAGRRLRPCDGARPGRGEILRRRGGRAGRGGRRVAGGECAGAADAAAPPGRRVRSARAVRLYEQSLF